MLDKNVKEVLDLSDIKGAMVEVMLNKYVANQQQKNGSKNSIDNRVASLYKAIKKEYDKFVELNSILS